MRPFATLLIRNAEQVVTARCGSKPEYAWRAVETLRGAVIACGGDRILAVGPQEEVAARVELTARTVVIDAVGCTVTPGLVDSHAHPVFAGSRLDEFEARLRGSSYEEIARKGGGILSTVRAVRQASEEELLRLALRRLDAFLKAGTTTLEAKSGYGLSLEHEVRLLRVLAKLRELHPIDIVPTFLGAHALPEEYSGRREAYVDAIVAEMLPAVAEEGLAEFCDVFCDEGFFTPLEAERILASASEHGLKAKIHAEQLSRSGGSRVAAKVGAVSADHLDHCTVEDLELLASARVVPVDLPGATFFLNKSRFAPARKMIELGMPLAVATDFNPGSSPIFFLPFAGSLACLKQGLSPAEAMAAITVGGAWALGRQGELGTLEEGKTADIVVWPTPDYRELFYYLGSLRPRWVIKKGRVVHQEE
ncbi:MAG: imidazolonepropionase [candidate division KSB1 bacterium]|nr:imidazolonepropionase [candidate division KSB1 bacterium]